MMHMNCIFYSSNNLLKPTAQCLMYNHCATNDFGSQLRILVLLFYHVHQLNHPKITVQTIGLRRNGG